MCRNQLGRRNLTEQMKMKLIQEEHDAIAKSVGAPVGNKNNNKSQFGEKSQIDFGDRNQTRRILADEHGISTHAVRAAVEFGRGLDAAEKMSPGIKDAVLSGEVKAPKSVIAEIRNLPEEKQKETAEAAGEELPAFVTRAVETQAQRDALSRKMKGGNANE